MLCVITRLNDDMSLTHVSVATASVQTFTFTFVSLGAFGFENVDTAGRNGRNLTGFISHLRRNDYKAGSNSWYYQQ